MKTLSKKRLVATATLALAMFGTTTLASANTSRFEPCKVQDRNNQVIGAIAGGFIGSVIGANSTNRGNRGNRGNRALLGALAGGTVGTAIADSQVKCAHEGVKNGFRGTQAGLVKTSGRGFNSRSKNRFNSGHANGFNKGYKAKVHHSKFKSIDLKLKKLEKSLADIDYKLGVLKKERYKLEKELKYNYSPYLKKEFDAVCYDILKFEKERRNVKREISYIHAQY